MRLRPRICVAVAAGLTLLAATACGSSSSGRSLPAAASESATSGASTAAAPLRGIIALGHSGLTGENSDPKRRGEPAPQNSWATGTNPAVNSIYQRLVAVDPTARGHAVNEATGGAGADALAGQASQALSVEPNPRLVIIQTIDDDIHCDGSDAANYPVFGREVKAALDVLVKASPQTTILLMSQPGRPLPASKAIVGTPAARVQSGADMCSPFDPNLKLDLHHIKTLTGIIERYEAELAKVCGTVPQCRTDDGRATRFHVPAGYYGSDWNHLNVTGLAALARFMWPTVAHVLDLR
jgi:hypothetical protein